MKTRILKSFLPIVAVAFGVFGAFAFNNAPEKNAVIDVNGVLPTSCEQTQVLCQTQNNGIFCKNASNVDLWRMNSAGTACPDHLYKKIQ